MALEIIGLVPESDYSETRGSYGAPLDVDYIDQVSRAHDAGGFDRVLLGYSASSADNWAVAARVLFVTGQLKVLIAHRPGFVQPTLLARKAATLDRLSGGGRVAVHLITGGNEGDQKRDGDYFDHDERYRRTAEFIEVLRQVWGSDQPFDHVGEFYRFNGAVSSVRPATAEGIPVFFGGASEAALPVGAQHADVYMVWAEPLAATGAFFERVRQLAAAHGRAPSFSVSVRPILADTEDEAWARADRIAQVTSERLAGRPGGFIPDGLSSSVGRQRLLDHADRQDVHDERLWTKVAGLTRAGGNTTALVGTPAQVAEAILRYYDLGADRILIRGFDPYQDAVDYGERLIPLVREGVRQREAALEGSVATG